MKKYSSVIVMVLCAVIVASFTIVHTAYAAGGTTYYIAQNGTASNSGTSASSPWPMSSLSSLSLQAGDSVLFERGDVFTGVALSFTALGNSGAPITFGAYGTGHNPVLDGSGSTNPVLEFSDSRYVSIADLVIQNSTSGSGGLYLYNCSNITIHNTYFTNVATGLYAQKCTGAIVFDGNYALNMQGPSPRGQMVQFNEVSGSGNAITNNKSQNILGQSHPEDIISLYNSTGTSGSLIEVSGNWIEGGGPSASGGGVMLGDGGGSYQIAEHNILVNPGQYGMAIAGGTHITISDNQVYAVQNTFTNVGIYVDNQSGGTCASHSVTNNQIGWVNAAGVSNPVWTSDNCGTITGWDANTIVSAIPSSVLPSPVWSGAPWDTVPFVPVPVPVPAPTPVSSGGGSSVSVTSSAPAPIVPTVSTQAVAPSIPNGCTQNTRYSPVTGQRCPNYSGTTEGSLGAFITEKLALGKHSTQVAVLQRYLNAHGFAVAPSGPGSFNHETTYFGPATKAAVKKFQQAYGLVPVDGIVGIKTRTVISNT